MSAEARRLLLVGLVPPEAGGFLSCGVASHVVELGREASARGYETTILAPLRPGAPARLDGARLLDASRPLPSRILAGGRAALRRRQDSLLSRLSWRRRVSILSWVERIRAAAEATRAEIIHVHPLSHPAGPGLSEILTGAPIVLTDHGFWQDLHDATDLECVRETTRTAAAVVSVSRHCLERQDRLGLKFGGVRVVIRNPVADLPAVSEETREAGGRKRVLFAAGVDALSRKGLDILVEAFAADPGLRAEAELVVVTGDEPGRWAAAAMAGKDIAGLVLPLRPRRGMGEAYRGADVLALPSRSEAFPLVFVEALAAGTPVVGFAPAVEELCEVLGPEAGRPFDAAEETAAGLADLLRQVLRAPSDRADLAKRAKAAFSWEAAFPAFDRLYRSLTRT